MILKKRALEKVILSGSYNDGWVMHFGDGASVAVSDQVMSYKTCFNYVTSFDLDQLNITVPSIRYDEKTHRAYVCCSVRRKRKKRKQCRKYFGPWLSPESYGKYCEYINKYVEEKTKSASGCVYVCSNYHAWEDGMLKIGASPTSVSPEKRMRGLSSAMPGKQQCRWLAMFETKDALKHEELLHTKFVQYRCSGRSEEWYKDVPMEYLVECFLGAASLAGSGVQWNENAENVIREEYRLQNLLKRQSIT